MNRRRRCGFFARFAVRMPNGERKQYIQLVTGWVKNFRASDGFLVRVGFYQNDSSGRWHIVESDSGLNCGDAETYDGAVRLLKERIDAMAEVMQTPGYVRMMHEFEFCLQFGEMDECGRKFFEDYQI